MVDLKINEIADHTIRQRWLRSQRDEGRPTEEDIMRETSDQEAKRRTTRISCRWRRNAMGLGRRVGEVMMRRRARNRSASKV